MERIAELWRRAAFYLRRGRYDGGAALRGRAPRVSDPRAPRGLGRPDGGAEAGIVVGGQWPVVSEESLIDH